MSATSRRLRQSQHSVHETVVSARALRFAPHGLFRHGAMLMAGASALTLLTISSPVHARALNGGSGGGAVSAPNIASDAAAQAAAQAAAAARQTQDSLARAARAMQDIQGVQAAARAVAAAAQISITAPITVPNGLGAGGLLPNMPAGWNGANAPTQSVDGAGQTQVNIRQLTQQAILNWQSFNVGARTTLTFDQGGNAGWVALNRVNNATAPSQILGNIKADGQVYVINQSGIIFGGNSQVNVGSLIASTAGITDDQFRNSGIFSTQNDTLFTPSFTAAGGKVVVETGASINTRAPSSVTSGGGFVLMIGSEVSNAGSIGTPKGQTVLAAGNDFVLRRGFGTDGNSSVVSTTRGIEIATGTWQANGSTGTWTSGGGIVSNRGLILAQQGDITLAGRTLVQDGALIATTSVNTRGTIHLLNAASDAAGSVTLSQASLTAILPELDSAETALDGQRETLIADSAAANAQRAARATGQFNNLSVLADRQDQSRIEIVTGGNVVFKGGSYIAAQGGQIAASAGKRIFAEDSATLDVSGVRNVALAMESNNLKVNVQGNELRDSPHNRDSDVLRSNDVWIDVRSLTLVPAGTGGYATDRYYTSGGLLEVGGHLINTAHKIGEWAAVGGTITLSAPEVIAQQGTVFDISGGSLDYAGGWMRSTNLIGRDGRRYSADNAPGMLGFVNFAGGFRRSHNIQGVEDERLTEIWTTVFDRGRTSLRWEDGYTVGRDAGRLILSAPTAVMEAKIIADAINGERQTKARPQETADGYDLPQFTRAQGGTLALGRYETTIGNNTPHDVDVKIGDLPDVTRGMSADGQLSADRIGTAWFDAARLNEARLGGLTLETRRSIVIERDLALADGGAVKLTAPVIDLAANITARSGSITATNRFESRITDVVTALRDADGGSLITLRKGAVLDLRGVWENSLGGNGKLGLLDGGDVYLASTHDLTLEKGSRIDVSSGAALLGQGKTQGGKGGNVALIADLEVADVNADGVLTLDGEIAAFSVTGGGTLKIESGTAISIGGKLLATDGVLAAGEAVPVELMLMEDYEIKAGTVLPVDVQYLSTRAGPGEVVGGQPSLNGLVLGAEWVLPYGTGVGITQGSYTVRYTLPGQTAIQTLQVRPAANAGGAIYRIPAGSRITMVTNLQNFPTSYVVPGDVFPAGMPIASFMRTGREGTVLSVDVTLPAGTRLVAGTSLPRAVAVKENSQLGVDLFQSGFANYDITSRNGVLLTPGTAVSVNAPVLTFAAHARSVQSGAAPTSALDLSMLPLYLEDLSGNELKQRDGASVTLRSSRFAVGSSAGVIAGGPVVIGDGASISVDDGQSINLRGFGITVEGQLRAPGGRITLSQPEDVERIVYGNVAPKLIFVGEKAVLDVAARPALARDRVGRGYGFIRDGGTIAIGGDLDWERTGEAFAPNAFVVIRPGALLDASGTSGVFDLAGNGMGAATRPVMVASDGGSIIIKSNNGLYIDGTLRAAAGGAGAAGGTLAVALPSPNYAREVASGAILNPREFVLAQQQGGSVLSVSATAGTVASELTNGYARLGVDRVKAGGFDTLSLLVNGALAFDGDVSLDLGQSLRLYTGTLALTERATADARISLSAPHVLLAGTTRVAQDNFVMPFVGWNNGNSQQATDAVFRIEADLIDVRDTVGFGANGLNPATSQTMDRRGFATVDLFSRGDLRLLGGIWRPNTPSAEQTRLESRGSIILTAAQIYPATEADARIIAGYQRGATSFVAGTSLTIRGHGSGEVAMPHSAFGRLRLHAETVNQGGVVRAPFGSLRLGASDQLSVQSASVNLLPGSITSVSGAGLILPYGGTSDGESYKYAGADIDLTSTIVKRGAIGGDIALEADRIRSEAGSTLDLSGGGMITGAGFNTGRGGSVDVLTTPFASNGPGYGFSDADNAVYAIVPSHRTGYAPMAPDAGFGDARVGQQITVPDGVPGLPAGTYTLMPSTYALQPGAFRVEIGAGDQTAMRGVTAIGNGSYRAAGTLSTANSDIRKALPNHMIITPADTVRGHSSYNEMNYNSFLLSDAARLGVPRTRLTVDGGALTIEFQPKGLRQNYQTELAVNGNVAFNPDAGSSGFGGSVSVIGLSEVLAPGSATTPGLDGASVSADALSAFNAPRLLLNASLRVNYGQTGRYATITGTGSIAIRSGATITAGEIIIGGSGRGNGTNATDGLILAEEGASLIARATAARAFDSSDGYLFRGTGAVVVSSGWVNMLLDPPGTGTTATNVDIDIGGCITASCARTTTMISNGTIAIATNGALTIAENVSYGTRNLVLALASVNLGEDARIAAVQASGPLPAGLVLNQGRFARLLAGNTAIGAPALETLVLNARDAVNIFGAVQFDASSLDSLVFGAPAFYGYGDVGEVATISANEFIWTGVEGAAGAPITGLLGDGTLAIQARSILFGYRRQYRCGDRPDRDHDPSASERSGAIDRRIRHAAPGAGAGRSDLRRGRRAQI